MKSYGQFCSVARALDLLGERWTLLIVRELLSGSRRFGEVQRGIPRISRTMLSARFRELVDAGVIDRHEGTAGGPEYRLTPAGLELAGVVRELGIWGQRWLPRELRSSELDPHVLIWDIHRRVRRDALPERPLVVRIELTECAGVQVVTISCSDAARYRSAPSTRVFRKSFASVRTAAPLSAGGAGS